MRKIKQVIVGFAVATVTVLTGASMAHGAIIDDPAHSVAFEQLATDFVKVRNVPAEQYPQFIADNPEWIEEVGERLDAFLADLPEEERAGVLRQLMNRNPLQRAGSLSDYFHSHIYHVRGGWNTYSLDPVLSVRLWGPSMEAAWSALAAYYSPIANDNGSLWNQYKCHWDLVVEKVWDIERGRPLVSYPATLAALCNP